MAQGSQPFSSLQTRPNGGNGAAVVVSRRCDQYGPFVLRLVPRHPLGAQLAVRAVGVGDLGGAVLFDEDDLRASASESVADGLSVLSSGVIELANSGDPISDRQTEILRQVMEGVPHMLVARRMYLSLSTVKRELRILKQVFMQNGEWTPGDSIRCLVTLLSAEESER